MTTKVTGYQHGARPQAVFGIANFGTGNGYDIPLPPGALLDTISVFTETAFDAATSAVLTVADGTTTFANAVDVMSTGAETVANTPKFYPSGGTLHVTGVQVGTSTVGRTIVTATYTQLNKQDDVFVGTGT